MKVNENMMKRKYSIAYAGIASLGILVFILGLIFGIREDFLGLEAAILCAFGVVYLLIKEPAWIIYLQIFYCLINKWLIFQFNAPQTINYGTDILMVICFLMALKRCYEKRERTYIRIPIIIAATFFLIGTLTSVLNGVSPLLILWSYRNLMRFILFFFSCVVLLEFEDLKNIKTMISIMFVINLVIVSIQFWIQGISQDYLGGIFGSELGCNGHMNTFLCICIAYACVAYISKQMSLLNFCIISAGALYIAALSELKFFFVEFICLLFMAILVSRFSWRIFLMVSGAAIGLIIGLELFNTYFPGWEFSLEQIWKYAGQGGYSTQYDLNRLTAIQRLSNEFLRETGEKLFGWGLGSCETSSFFNSSFFTLYGERLHYTYLLQAFLFLETGWIGLLLFLGFFVSIFLLARKFWKECSGQRQIFCKTGAIMAGMCVIHCFYNNALRVENSGYLAYFVLAIPFICRKRKTNKYEQKN